MSIEIRELNVRTELVNASIPKIAEEIYEMEQRILKRVIAANELHERRINQKSKER